MLPLGLKCPVTQFCANRDLGETVGFFSQPLPVPDLQLPALPQGLPAWSPVPSGTLPPEGHTPKVTCKSRPGFWGCQGRTSGAPARVEFQSQTLGTPLGTGRQVLVLCPGPRAALCGMLSKCPLAPREQGKTVGSIPRQSPNPQGFQRLSKFSHGFFLSKKGSNLFIYILR